MASSISMTNKIIGHNEKVKVKNVLAAGNTKRAALGDIGNKVKGSNNVKGQEFKVVKKENLNAREKTLKDNLQLELPIKVESCLPVSKAFSVCLLDVHDIDKDDGNDPQMVSELVNDIYDHLRGLEMKYPIKNEYLRGKHITGSMRAILIDWLVQVHQRFRLLQETLYLTVAIIDRFIQKNEVSRKKLQLIGVTAMFIAAKYEEIYAPEIGDFVYITANAFSKLEIRRMEIIILKSLNFSLGRPLALHFLRRNSKAAKATPLLHTLAKYLMELTLTEYDMVHHMPSKIAAASLCIALKIVDNKSWTDTLVYYSTYTEKELHSVMKQMAKIVIKPSSNELVAVKSKYSNSSFMKISTIPELQSDEMKKLAEGLFT